MSREWSSFDDACIRADTGTRGRIEAVIAPGRQEAATGILGIDAKRIGMTTRGRGPKTFERLALGDIRELPTHRSIPVVPSVTGCLTCRRH